MRFEIGCRVKGSLSDEREESESVIMRKCPCKVLKKGYGCEFGGGNKDEIW